MLRSLILTGCALTLSFFPGLNAQSSEGISVSTEIPSTTTRDFNSETSSVPLATPTAGGQPCGRIASIINAGGAISNLSVPAEVAYECLTSVPVRQDAALGTIDALVKMVQFQSNLAYLKDPPEGYDNPPVDILGGLAEIRNKVSSNEFSNQFDFEAEIAGLLNSARDGHFGFDGPTYVGAVRWRRDAATVLISTSLDGGPPKIYHLGMSLHISLIFEIFLASPLARVEHMLQLHIYQVLAIVSNLPYSTQPLWIYVLIGSCVKVH